MDIAELDGPYLRLIESRYFQDILSLLNQAPSRIDVRKLPVLFSN